MTKNPTYEELEQRVEELERESFERKRAEEELRYQKKRLESLIEYSSLAIVTVDEGHNIISCNRDFEELFYFRESEIVGKNLDELIASDEYIEAAISYTKESLEGKTVHGADKRQRKDGTYVDVEFIAVPVNIEGKVIGAYGIYQDISERKQAEEALRESEEKYRFLTENIADIVWTLDRDFRTTYVSSSIEKVLGFTHEERKRQTLEEMITPESVQRLQKMFLEELRLDEDSADPDRTVTIEVEYYRKDGSTVWMENRVKAIRDPAGAIVGIHGVSRDITERKQADDALRESEERYRSLVENTMDGYFICEIPSGRFLFLNQRSCDLHGYTMQEGLERTVWDVMSPEDHGRIQKRIQTRLEKKKLSSERQTYTGVRKDGSTFRVEISTSLVTFQGGPAVQGVLRDITEQERLEQQLQQAQKMEAIGTLSGGIAHDFNNLLMGIQGRTSLMLMDKDRSHPDFEHLKGIEDHVKSAADLTKQLLGFARGGRYEVKPTDINELIKKCSTMFGRTKKEIKIHGKYMDNIWTIEADQGQVEQVLMNLYVNAWQAMPNGGDLYVQTENVTLDEEHVKTFKIKPGEYVKISVTDTGVGMDEATRQRIFDPFFTTKEMGRGTGLGLASAYGIIKNHGGFINVYSEKGEGTTFNIYLPASESEVGGQRSEVSDGVKHGDETVLLVDDENMIIDVGEQLLHKLGYTVLIARNGKEATEIYEKNKDKIDLIILDMIMPALSGGDTFDRLKEINPEVKVLLSSGYSINGQATEILQRGCDGFIQKPFNMKGLSQKLRQILDKE